MESERKLLRGFKRLLRRNSNVTDSHEISARAFDEMAVFMFQINLNFEIIIESLLAVGKKAGVGGDRVKRVLQKHQDLFYHQLNSQAVFLRQYSVVREVPQLSRGEKVVRTLGESCVFL